MSKIIYDVIQRFEVENGVPRLVSTNIQVIEGGEDLLSLAINMLAKMGFDEKFEEKRTSQYIGYRLKNPGKGAKRYQLVLSQRQDSLYISIPKKILDPLILEFRYDSFVGHWKDTDYEMITLGRFWVLPSKKAVFLKSFNYSEVTLNHNIKGSFYFNWTHENIPDQDYPRHFNKANMADKNSYLILEEDKLFPYTWQAIINSVVVLEEFLTYFAKILMEKN